MTATATPSAPLITSVNCQTGGTLPVFALTWQPQQNFQGPFTILVFDSTDAPVTGTNSNLGPNGGTWTATGAMDATTQSYYVRVAVAANTGVVSDKVALLFAPATAIKTEYDGITLSVGWTAPVSQMPAGTYQILLMTPAGAQAVVTSGSGFDQMVVAANLRRSTGEWSVYVTPQLGMSGGPDSDAATVYTLLPVVTALTVLGVQTTSGSATAVHLGLDITLPSADAEETSFVAVLKADGRTVQTSAPITGTWVDGTASRFCSTSVSFTYPFNLAAGFEVAAAQSTATAGIATGPVGIASALVLQAPQDVSATVTAQGNDRVVTARIAPFGGVGLNGSRIAVNGPNTSHTTGALTSGFQPTLTLTAPTIGGAYSLFGAQAQGSSIGPWSGGLTYPGDGTPSGTGLPLITSLPALTSIAIDDGIATLHWGAIADAGLVGYLVQASIGKTVIAENVFTGTSGTLAVSGDGITFSIAGLGSNVTGPASPAVTAITAPPSQPGGVWSSTATQCSLHWQAPTGNGATPDGYKIEIFDGITSVHQATATTCSYLVPAGVLNGAGSYHFCVAATAATTPARTGPWSPSAPIVVAAPAALAVSYDGATLTARWAAVPNATGYRVALLLNQTESGTPSFTTSPDISIPLAFDSTKSYRLAVQACGPGSTGPAATEDVFAAGLYPHFATNTAPALIPAKSPAMSPFTISIGLPQIFTATPATLPATAPFALAAGTAPYTYVLTIDGASAASLPWAFTAEPIREDLRTAYTTFLGQLETAGATPFGLQTVQAAIARAMPQTFAESLLYTYSYTGSSGYADLRPGMVLRVEYQSYQTMTGDLADPDLLSGFITSAVAHYPIGLAATDTANFTALDTFIGQLTGLGGTEVDEPDVTDRKQAGAGGLIDSGYTHMHRPFLRLVYPPGFPCTDQPGTPYPEFNALLIAASKLSDLETATASIRASGAPGNTVGALYFRGRTTMVPLIRVWVDGVERTVPLGTTIGQILAERGMEPSAVDLPLTGLRVRRGIGPALVGSPSVYDFTTANEVRLDWAPAGKAALTTLPLLGGDRIDFV
ncbi:hypothetical protein [Magnetospirillum fulvum]|uniref:Flavoprotein n=1 Tax=Magnetospirillum fulvum TaxID=1082 RepID=A0A1H6I0Q2_MAGFU|nr:hypothetical protein [Magnetospirillum fulvum]SEH40112.1 flavoprotein [Magnetospirillum fulvum]